MCTLSQPCSLIVNSIISTNQLNHPALIIKHLCTFPLIGLYVSTCVCTCSGCLLSGTQSMKQWFNGCILLDIIQTPVSVFMEVEWKTGILTEEKTMEMLYEWWRWICHSLCHAMTMTYKIQDTALSHALHCHLCNNFPTTWARLREKNVRKATLTEH